jgi:hypothetical protein
MDYRVLEIASGVLTKREVKTPMAFYSRMIWVILALIVAPPYSHLNDPYKSLLPIAGVILFIGLLLWVGFLNYKKPEYLLYGAETHFEKWRMEYAPTAISSGIGSTPSSSSPLEPIQDSIVVDH